MDDACECRWNKPAEVILADDVATLDASRGHDEPWSQDTKRRDTGECWIETRSQTWSS